MTTLAGRFELGYHRQDVPGVEALSVLAEMLTDDVHDEAPVRESPRKFSANKGRATGVRFVGSDDREAAA